MQITIDHAAAAPEAPAMISPRMICTTLFLPSLPPRFCHVSSVFTTTFQQHAHHHLRTVAQLAPQTTTFSFTLHNEKQRASVDSLIFNMLSGSIQTPSCIFQVSLCSPRSFEVFSLTPFSDSMTVLTPPLLPPLTVLHPFSHFQLAQINNRCSTPTIQ